MFDAVSLEFKSVRLYLELLLIRTIYIGKADFNMFTWMYAENTVSYSLD